MIELEIGDHIELLYPHFASCANTGEKKYLQEGTRVEVIDDYSPIAVCVELVRSVETGLWSRTSFRMRIARIGYFYHRKLSVLDYLSEI